MTCAEVQGSLSRLVDCELSAAAQKEVQAHLDACQPCRDLHEELLALRQAAAGLADAELPGQRAAARAVKEQWQALAGELAAGRRGRRVALLIQVGALAALLVLALALVLRWTGEGEEPERQRARLELSRLAQQQERTLTALKAVLDRRRTSWDPELQGVVARNTALVEEAIAQCRRALLRRPTDLQLRASLASAYQRRLELYRLLAQMEDEP